MRVGNGVDVHAFGTDDRPLVLGGVVVPGAPGLAGHSDADVVAHALADALLGAAALGDLGGRFGVDEDETAGADSLALLAAVAADVHDAGWQLANADLTVIAQRPRLAGQLDAIRARLAATLTVEVARVSVKATSTDGLGAIGHGEGIACVACCLLVATRET